MDFRSINMFSVSNAFAFTAKIAGIGAVATLVTYVAMKSIGKDDRTTKTFSAVPAAVTAVGTIGMFYYDPILTALFMLVVVSGFGVVSNFCGCVCVFTKRNQLV